jgi:hypothetical protein
VGPQDKKILKDTKSRVLVVEDAIQKLGWEHEILQQKHAMFVEERDLLFQKLEQTIYDAQQKAGFQQLLVEKHIEAAHATLEAKDTALHEVVVSSNLRPEVVSAITRNMHDVLSDKNKGISELEDQLREWRQVQTHGSHSDIPNRDFFLGIFWFGVCSRV